MRVFVLCAVASMAIPHEAYSQGSIRVATLNAHREAVDVAAVKKWVAELKPDVIVLQEVFGNRSKGISKVLAREFSYTLHFEANHRDGEGNSVLTKLPGEFSHWVVSGSSKKIVVFEPEGLGLRLLGVHLPALGKSRRTESARSANRRRAIEIMKDKSGEKPTLAIGDFNFSSRSASYQAMAGLATDHCETKGATWPARSPLFRVDYAWSWPSLLEVECRVGQDVGSDHLPLIVDITIP